MKKEDPRGNAGRKSASEFYDSISLRSGPTACSFALSMFWKAA
jgi:hypothetical protein